MPTSFDTVIDLALITVNDYKLMKLYNRDAEGFQKWCDGFLISAVPNFVQCQKDLTYDLTTREFNADLSNMEISILADYWVIKWLEREVQNSAQIQLKLKTSGSFQFNSEAQNLKEKSTYLDKLREKVRQKTTEYQLNDLSQYDI